MLSHSQNTTLETQQGPPLLRSGQVSFRLLRMAVFLTSTTSGTTCRQEHRYAMTLKMFITSKEPIVSSENNADLTEWWCRCVSTVDVVVQGSTWWTECAYNLVTCAYRYCLRPCQFLSFVIVLQLCKTLPLGRPRGGDMGPPCTFLCNFLRTCNYFKIKS